MLIWECFGLMKNMALMRIVLQLMPVAVGLTTFSGFPAFVAALSLALLSQKKKLENINE